MPRQCGTCSACCRWPSVPEINKPVRVPCQHLRRCGFGCTIYADRPKTCADYRCSWLRGVGNNRDQPDKCGVLIDRRMTGYGEVLVAKPLKPGAARTARGRGAISRAALSDKTLCLVTDYNDDEVVIGVAGLRALVDQFKADSGGMPTALGGVKEHAARLVRHYTGMVA